MFAERGKEGTAVSGARRGVAEPQGAAVDRGNGKTALWTGQKTRCEVVAGDGKLAVGVVCGTQGDSNTGEGDVGVRQGVDNATGISGQANPSGVRLKRDSCEGGSN